MIAFGQILPKAVLELPKYGCWNAHASLLPRWRGAAPIQWSLMSGDNQTGVGVMLMEEGLDTGPILLEKKIKISPLENSDNLRDRLSTVSSEAIIEAFEIIKNKNLSSLKLKHQNTLNKILVDQLIDYKIRGPFQ